MGNFFFKKKSFHDEEPLINLTPLIDVVFVILIAFIVIAPLLEKEEILLASAGKDNVSSVSTASPIKLHVFSDNTIALNGQKLHDDELAERLRREKVAHPEAIPQLFHDKNARFGTYQKVKNSVLSAGFDSLELVLDPQ